MDDTIHVWISHLKLHSYQEEEKTQNVYLYVCRHNYEHFDVFMKNVYFLHTNRIRNSLDINLLRVINHTNSDSSVSKVCFDFKIRTKYKKNQPMNKQKITERLE